MTTVATIKRGALASALVGFLLPLYAGVQPAAARPWWHLATMSVPAGPKTTEANIELYISNLGTSQTEGKPFANINEYISNGETKNFVTVVDTLPPGVAPTAVHAEGGGTSLGENKERELEEDALSAGKPPLCSVAGQTVTCKYASVVRPYEQIIVSIAAHVAPGAGNGENELAVSGSGSSEAVARRPLALEDGQRYGIQSYEITPEEEGGLSATQAGAHPFQLTTTLMLDTHTQLHPVGGGSEMYPEAYGSAYTKDLRFSLPPGLIGNPTPLPKCPLKTFALQADVNLEPRVECPTNTVVGVASVITAPNIGLNPVHVPTSKAYPLYSLEPSVGEPAKFGFQVPIYGPVILDTAVRTGGDYGVVVTVPNITENALFAGSQVTFWGVPGDSRHDGQRGGECLGYTFSTFVPQLQCPTNEKPVPFLIMPTACTGPLHTSVEADSWANVGQFSAKEYTFESGLDGCNQLPFEPTISVAPDGQQASTPSGLTVGVHVPQGADLLAQGVADSTVRDTRVTLPAGVSLDASGADGLLSCGMFDIGLESAADSACPESSKIGTVEIKTPLLPNPLVGAAYLAQQNANPFGSLIALYLVAYDPVSGVRIKLAGQVTPDPVTGQLTSTFDETPDLPFEDLKLHFFGGSRAPLGTPALCGTYTTSAAIAPWSGNPPVTSSSSFEITSGPNGTPCAAPLPFAPTLHAGASSIQAGGFTPFTMTMSREDGSQNLDAITLHMPPGLLGTLSHVELCGEPQADEGLCGPNSQIGETTISVGLGGNPYTVRGGKVFITGPYGGAPYGLAIVNPAKAGPFDVEHDTSNPAYQNACDCVVVRAKIEVDPTTAALTITSDTTGAHRIPTILDGIPLEIKHINVTINRPEFTFNPTNCEKMAVTGSLTSSEGATDSLSVPFQVTNCATLGFQPQFSVSTSARTSRADGASLHVKLTYPNVPYDQRANVAKVRVELPLQLPSRLTTLQRACPDTVFDANPDNCPPASKVGEAVATTPVIPEDFRGPAYFVSHGGAKFPELIIALHGYALTIELHGETFISKAGVTSTTFNTVPDVPIGSFELNLPAGPDSALAANGDLCAQKLAMPTTFTAQNGVVIEQRTPIHVEGCTPEIRVLRHRVAGKWATVVVSVPSAGRLVAGGGGVVRSTKRISKAGAITLRLRLSKREQRFVAHHQGRRLRVPIKLSFKPASGENLKATVAVLMR